MTDKQQELFKELFTKYGSYLEEYNTKTIYLHAEHPNKIKTTAEIEKRIDQVNKDITMLNNYIEMLQAYNISLVERYNFLCCCNYTKIIRLKREKRYNNKVFYFLCEIMRNDETGQEELTNCIKYSGTERAAAIKEFERMKTINKNAVFEMDIKKSKFER